MSLQKIPVNPGVYKDDTPLTAEGFFIDADKVRFRRGLPEAMGGYELLTSTTLRGLARGIVSWADNNLVKWLSIGTHTNLYALTDSVVYDITPIISRSNEAINFTTIISSAVVTMTRTAHGLIVGQQFSFANPTVTTVGGVTIAGLFFVLSVVDANNITYTAASAATSSAGPTASTVDYFVYLAPGLQNSIGALGYGTGVYSSGTYSSPATGAVYARTWCEQPYGQNLLALPRGGKLYEWAPITAATELVTNGTFTGSAAGWTLAGAGLAYAANNVAWAASGGVLSQAIVGPTNAFNVLVFDITAFAAGTMQVSFNGVNIGSAIAANGRYWITFFSNGGSQTLAFTGTGFTATIDTVSVQQELVADVVPNAPTQNSCMVVTSEGFVMVGGTINAGSGLFDPMLIRWSDIGSKTNAEQTWTPASSNLSGSFRPLVGSRIVAMKVCNNEILVWTDKALYAAVYVNNSAIVYSLRLIGIGCGLLGANAATVNDGTAYWMSTGSFYSYSGGGPVNVPSGIQRDVFSNVSFVQQDKIFAGTISTFNDVIYLYPDQRDGTECSRYALHDTQEGAPSPPGVNLGPIGVFAPGTFDRTCWDDGGVLPFPVAVSSGGQIFYQEKGQTANGGVFTWSLKHGAVQIGNGDTLFAVDSLIPDFEQIVGGCTVTASSYYYPKSTAVSHGPFSVGSTQEKVSMLSDAPLGREIVLNFIGSGSPAWMRAGHHMFDIHDTGMNF